MRAHNGMRPQDIVILLKILSYGQKAWRYRDLSADLSISISEVSESLNRSSQAELIDQGRRVVFRKSLMEFIEFGLRYVFPQAPGPIVTGIPTAHSHSFYEKYFVSETDYVWADADGTLRGQAVDPLHKGVAKAVREDPLLYKMLAGIDIIRVGRNREVRMAIQELENSILGESTH